MSVEKTEKKEEKVNGVNGTHVDTVDAQISYTFTLSLVFGGCCTNAWSLEKLLIINNKLASTATFLQLIFVALQSLPHVLHRPKDATYLKSAPRFRPPTVPLRIWSLQVIVLLGVNVFNNWTLGYNIPLTLQIIFRSSGVAVSMLFGVLFLGKSYSKVQVLSVLIITLGVLLATMSRPSPSHVSPEAVDITSYVKGVTYMTLSVLLSGVLGTLQETTYRKYGPVWKEGLFYTHALALPLLIIVASDLKPGLQMLARELEHTRKFMPIVYIVLIMNVLTQAACVSGVSRLISTQSSVETNVILTARKALSLIISILWFGSGWNMSLGIGGGLVAVGTILYNSSEKPKKEKVE